MKVVLSAQATAALSEIGDYIARDNPARAASFVRELRASARAIGDMPHGFPLLPGREQDGIRRRAFRGYIIFYRIEAGRVSILHILHAARDHRPLLPAER